MVLHAKNEKSLFGKNNICYIMKDVEYHNEKTITNPLN